MGMLDWFIILVVTFSTVISLWRGATREIMSLASWVVAGWFGFKYNSLISPAFTEYIDNPALRTGLAFLLMVIFILVVGTVIAQLLTKAVNFAGLSGLDRLVGVFFGFARGVVILAILTLLASFTELPSEPWWQNSKLMPELELVANEIASWLEAKGYEPFEVDTANGSGTFYYND